MKHQKKHNCMYCNDIFVADPRNEWHQNYCSKPDCRKASKAASNLAWLSKPENHDHFRGSVNVARVQAWRAANPGYWRRPKGKKGAASEKKPEIPEAVIALQDVCLTQPIEIIEDSVVVLQPALQDFLLDQPPVLIGFIAKFTGTTLQEDMAQTFRHLVKLGHDILAGGISDDHQARAQSRTDSTYSGSIQLGRSPLGSGAVSPAL